MNFLPLQGRSLGNCTPSLRKPKDMIKARKSVQLYSICEMHISVLQKNSQKTEIIAKQLLNFVGSSDIIE